MQKQGFISQIKYSGVKENMFYANLFQPCNMASKFLKWFVFARALVKILIFSKIGVLEFFR